MTHRHQSSIVERGLNPVIIESGRVVNVNMRRWTADVRTITTQSIFFDVQWGSPYLHFNSGEGIYAMPEVGAKCLVLRPSEAPPVIICFITTFERTGAAPTSEGSEDQVEPDQSETSENSTVNFSAGRPQLQQGDIMLKTRDGNMVYLRRGGVVEIGANETSKRYYIPLMNFIRDICENYEMLTPAGDMTWTVKRTQQTSDRGTAGETSSDRDVEVLFTLTARNYAQDAKATVALRIGHVDDEKRLKLLVASNAIDPNTMEVTGTEAFRLDIDRDGNVEAYVDKDVELSINGQLTVNVTQDASLTFGSNLNESVSGDLSIDVSGSHELQAQNSRERLTSKVIDCPNIKLGGDGATRNVVILTETFVQWLMSHTHVTSGSPPTPPLIVSTIIANNVKAQ